MSLSHYAVGGSTVCDHRGETRDFKTTTMADTIEKKPVDSGKRFFDISINTGQICMGVEAVIREK